MIRCESVSKIFGDNPEQVFQLLEQGKTKDEIREETGQVIGVNDVSFELEPGEVFVIMGLSGSGKSTLIRCVNRLIEPTRGKIFLKDENGEEIDITGLDEKGLRQVRTYQMSMVFQHFGLFPHRTVQDNVTFGLEIQGQTDKDKNQKVAQDVLEMVGLGGWGTAMTHELSGGMQQRVGLARALATQARVLLMDEPFSALDPLIKVQMQDELLKIEQHTERTILFITHDLDEALKLGDHIAIMEAGQIVQLGTPEDIIVNPRTEYVANFVEHADPTGVITAKTICVSVEGRLFERMKEEEGLRYYARKSSPDTLFGVNGEGKLEKLIFEGGKPAKVRQLGDVVDDDFEVPDARRQDVALACTPETTLREVIRGRLFTRLPILVQDGEGRLQGIIGEREFVQGILEKRGSQDEANGASEANPVSSGASAS